jgi:hypothetical protein
MTQRDLAPASGVQQRTISRIENPDWELHTGDVEALTALQGDGRQVAYLEQSVRFRNGNPYSLGLDLTAGAIALDLASLIGSQSIAEYIGWALTLHVILLVGNFGLLVSN